MFLAIRNLIVLILLIRICRLLPHLRRHLPKRLILWYDCFLEYFNNTLESEINNRFCVLQMVDASQLANIDLSDEVTQLLTSIMKTDTSTSQPTPSESLPSNVDKDDRVFAQTR